MKYNYKLHETKPVVNVAK